MPEAEYTAEEVVQRGRALYEQQIRARVEPDHIGQFIVIDIGTGDYEVDADELAAFDRAIAKNPNGRRCLLRVGYPAAHRIGGSWRLRGRQMQA